MLEKNKEFNSYDFVRLFLACLKSKGVILVDLERMKTVLAEFYNAKEFELLFKEIKLVFTENGNFLKLDDGINQALLYNNVEKEEIEYFGKKRRICFSEEEIVYIKHRYEQELTDQMDYLVFLYMSSEFRIINGKPLTR